MHIPRGLGISLGPGGGHLGSLPVRTFCQDTIFKCAKKPSEACFAPCFMVLESLWKCRQSGDCTAGSVLEGHLHPDMVCSWGALWVTPVFIQKSVLVHTNADVQRPTSSMLTSGPLVSFPGTDSSYSEIVP